MLPILTEGQGGAGESAGQGIAARRVCECYRNYKYNEEKQEYEYPSVSGMVHSLGWMPLEERRKMA
jgi:hypothetical protein